MAILGLLEIGPLHTYGIQQLIKKWHKDQVINVGQRASLYKVIARLETAGLVREHEVTGGEKYPEKTSYELTDTGRTARISWLKEMLSTPRYEFPEFPAALAFMMSMRPAEIAPLLRERLVAVETQVAELDEILATEIPEGQRAALIESEYLGVLAVAERDWLADLVKDFDAGTIDWPAPGEREFD